MVDLSFPHVQHKLLRGLIAYWFEKRAERSMPSRADIDPVDIPWALGCIWLCDYQPWDGRFRYRLAGEKINAFWGGSVSGKYLDEIVPEAKLEDVSRTLLAAFNGPSIVHDFGQMYLADELFATGERIILPLSNDGREVTSLLGASCRNWYRDLALDEALKSRQTATHTPLNEAPATRAAQPATLNFAP